MAKFMPPQYRRQFLAKEVGQLNARMKWYQDRVLQATKLNSIDKAEAWLAEVSTSKGVRDLQRAVRGILAEATTYARDWVKTNIPKAYQTGTEISARLLADSGIVLKDLGRTQLNASAINFSMEQMAGDMRGAIGSISQKLNRMFREMHVQMKEGAALTRTLAPASLERAANQAVATSLARGESYRTAAQDMYQTFQKKIGSGFVTVVGESGKPRTYDLEYYTDMVARTRTREAAVQGFKNSMIENSMDFVQVTAYGTDCEICVEFEDKIYSLSGAGELDNPDFEGPLDGDSEPPYHPNCTHMLVPYIPEEGEVVNDPTGTFADEGASAEGGD